MTYLNDLVSITGQRIVPVFSPVALIILVLGLFRIADLFLYDYGPFRVFSRLRDRQIRRRSRMPEGDGRKRIPSPIECPRCLVLWLAPPVVLLWLYQPLLLLPPALSYLFNLQTMLMSIVNVRLLGRRETSGRELLLSVSSRGEVQLVRSDLDNKQVIEVASHVIQSLAGSAPPHQA